MFMFNCIRRGISVADKKIFPKSLDKNLLSNANLAKKASNPAVQSNSRFLARDFIHDSLYDQENGYFSKRAVIFSPPEPVEFSKLLDNSEFSELISKFYKEYEDYEEDESLQVWHTPTELFQPYYGRALAKYILELWEQKYPNEPLIIYEIGAGNGTLVSNILEYIKQSNAETYNSMQYNIIEISQQLSERQEWNNMSELQKVAANNSGVNIINRSIFEWDKIDESPCIFIALEVIDNFPHDCIRYNLSTPGLPFLKPLETWITKDSDGHLEEVMREVCDPLILRYLELRARAGYESPLIQRTYFDQLKSWLSLESNLTLPEFVPTMQMKFFEILCQKFPRHNLILSDFSSLPTPVSGIDAPVVQTRQKYRMVQCSTYLVTSGWFDIFFPTNFELMEKIYQLISKENGILTSETKVLTQPDFMFKYADLKSTTTKSGENPLLENYQNVKFLLSSRQ